VLAVKADHKTKLATIGTAKEEPVPRDAILAELNAIGYSGQWVEQ
jgi:hypothetical protein